MLYRAYAKSTDDEIIETANYFRENNISVDIMGLEPGWQSNSYSCSYLRDKERYNIDDEYIFCDKLVVAPLTAKSDKRRVYLPEGSWVDYWTKQLVDSGWFNVCTKNIPVFDKR